MAQPKRRIMIVDDRKTGLIADFSNGYAEGWAFAVGWCFHEELGIQWKKRTRGDQEYWTWVQTPYFAFKPNQIIYDTREAYLRWAMALRKFKYMIQTLSASPDANGPQGKKMAGFVSFQISTPTEDRTGIKSIGIYTLSQDDFVRVLRDGPIWLKK